MNILFIHQNFPGQFLHLAADLAANRKNKVVALSIYQHVVPKGVILKTYTMLRPAAKETHPLLLDQEAKILRAEACASAALQLKNEGFIPDLIIAHPGWGEALFMKEVFPQTKLVIYCEYYYALEGQDVGFDPEVNPLNFAQRCKLRLKNTTNLLSMEIADAAISPTQWQKSTYPAWAQEKITVIHDGIDFERLQFNPKAKITLAANQRHPQLCFQPGDEVVSYVARNLEPIRGFQMLMRSLPKVLKKRQNANIIIIGGDEVSYGAQAPNGQNWKNHLLAEVGEQLDLQRIHFVGKVPYQSYLDLLSISKVHTYWTSPFVLSWSFLEAAVSGVPVIASNTQPVMEFAEKLGVETHNFFDKEAFSDAIISQLSKETTQRNPQPDLQEINLKPCLKRQKKFLEL